MKITSNPSPTRSDSAVVQWVKKLDMTLLGLQSAKGVHPWGSLAYVHTCAHILLPKWAAVCVLCQGPLKVSPLPTSFVSKSQEAKKGPLKR